MIVKSDESLNLDIAIAAMALAERLDDYYTKPRETQLPRHVVEMLKEYRRRKRQVPEKPYGSE